MLFVPEISRGTGVSNGLCGFTKGTHCIPFVLRVTMTTPMTRKGSRWSTGPRFTVSGVSWTSVLLSRVLLLLNTLESIIVTDVAGSMGSPELGQVFGSWNVNVDRKLFRSFGSEKYWNFSMSQIQ